MDAHQPLRELTLRQYIFRINHPKSFGGLNPLGLYRSIVENEKLTLEEKIEVRDYAHQTFLKSFNFLQLKDPSTFFKVSTLGQTLSRAEELQLWDRIKRAQEEILAAKKIKHRSFGVYSKHMCGHESCVYDGVMIRTGAFLEECAMLFHSDRNRRDAINRARQRKSDRKKMRRVIDRELDSY